MGEEKGEDRRKMRKEEKTEKREKGEGEGERVNEGDRKIQLLCFRCVTQVPRVTQ